MLQGNGMQSFIILQQDDTLRLNGSTSQHVWRVLVCVYKLVGFFNVGKQFCLRLLCGKPYIEISNIQSSDGGPFDEGMLELIQDTTASPLI